MVRQKISKNRATEYYDMVGNNKTKKQIYQVNSYILNGAVGRMSFPSNFTGIPLNLHVQVWEFTACVSILYERVYNDYASI